MNEERLPREIRWQLPKAIGRFGDMQAARMLAERLPMEGDGVVRTRLVSELERLKLLCAPLGLPEDPLERTMERMLDRGYRMLDWRRHLEELTEPHERHTEVHGLLARMLEDKEAHACDLVMRLTALEIPADIVEHLLEASFDFLLGLARWIAAQLLEESVEEIFRSERGPAGGERRGGEGAGELDFVERLAWMRRSMLFGDANLEAVAELVRHQRRVEVEAGELLWEADDPDTVYSLVDGTVSLDVPDRSDEETRRIRGQRFLGLLGGWSISPTPPKPAPTSRWSPSPWSFRCCWMCWRATWTWRST